MWQINLITVYSVMIFCIGWEGLSLPSETKYYGCGSKTESVKAILNYANTPGSARSVFMKSASSWYLNSYRQVYIELGKYLRNKCLFCFPSAYLRNHFNSFECNRCLRKVLGLAATPLLAVS